MVNVSAGKVVVRIRVCVLIDTIVDASAGDGVRVNSTVGPGAVSVTVPQKDKVRSMKDVIREVSAGRVVVSKTDVVCPGSVVLIVNVSAGNVVVRTRVCVLIDTMVDAAAGDGVSVISIVAPGAVHVAPGSVHVAPGAVSVTVPQ